MNELKKDQKPKRARSKRLLPDKVFDQPTRILERVEVDFIKLDIIAVNLKNALLEFFITFGGPKIIVIDNGDCFQSESFDRASSACGELKHLQHKLSTCKLTFNNKGPLRWLKSKKTKNGKRQGPDDG